MQEIVASIRVNGVMVPGLARPEKDGNGYHRLHQQEGEKEPGRASHVLCREQSSRHYTTGCLRQSAERDEPPFQQAEGRAMYRLYGL